MLNKDDDSYVSVGDAFHPSMGSDALSPELRQQLEQEENQNMWGVVWAEATLVPTGETNRDISKPEVLVDEGSGSPQPIKEQAPVADPNGTSTRVEEVNFPPSSPLLRNGHCMDILLGSSLAIAAVCSTYALELGASVVYSHACVFYYLSQKCNDIGVMLYLFYGIFFLVAVILLAIDSTLLVVSVVGAELLANLAFLLCFIFGGPRVASEWKQYIRRICHLTRWAFRGCFQKENKFWILPRSILAVAGSSESSKKDADDDVASAVVMDGYSENNKS